jgi:integrase
MASVGTKFGAHESSSLSPPILDDDVLSAAWTGLRQGEILGLQWEDIDFTSRFVEVRRTVGYGHLVPGANRSAVDRLAEATGRNLTATDEGGRTVT